MLTNFDALKQKDVELHKLAQAYSGCKAGQHKLDESMFPADIWQQLVAFVNKEQRPKQIPSPATPDIAARAAEPDFEEEKKADLDRAAANGRFLQLQDEEGLIDCESNAKMIGNFFEHHKLSLTVKNVNTAVEALRPGLAWRPKLRSSVAPVAPAVPVAQPPAAAEVLDTLPDGSRQLPLGTTPSKKHTVAQLRDLDKRQAGLRRPAGSFGSRF